MEAFYKLINKNYIKLQRHAFSTNAHSHSMFHDLDDLIRQKENFIDYIKFEYSISILYNLTMSISTLLYIKNIFPQIFAFDYVSTMWLILVSFIKLCEILPKLILIYQTIRISNNNTDPIMCSRRLMHMTRSNIFYYNTILSYTLLASYTIFFLFVRRSIPCLVSPKFYYNINVLIWGFCFRIILSFVNYHFYFKYDVNEADMTNSTLYVDYHNRVSPDIIEMIETHCITNENIDKLIEINEENERDVCCICMNAFCVDEYVKILPCNNKHVFHKTCIEKWLSHNKACPNCRKEITKKTVEKIKMF